MEIIMRNRGDSVVYALATAMLFSNKILSYNLRKRGMEISAA